MNVFRVIGATVLIALLGIADLAYAGQEHPSEKQDRSKPQQKSDDQARPQQPRQEQSRPEQQHAQQPRPDLTRPQQQIQPQQVRQPQVRQQIGRVLHPSPEQQGAQRSAWQEHRAGNWLTNHRTWQQRGGYHGYRIPNLRFQADFGPGHGFQIRGLPFMLENGYPQFQYGGYWVRLVDPWPEYWGDDWYEKDAVYINYVDDGYYLFDDKYPSAGIAVSISL
jgi:hypothetical protein